MEIMGTNFSSLFGVWRCDSCLPSREARIGRKNVSVRRTGCASYPRTSTSVSRPTAFPKTQTLCGPRGEQT